MPGDTGHCVAFDPDRPVLYVGDGYGVASAALRMHLLSLDDGAELASVRLCHQGARSLAFPGPSTVLVATDSRLFELSRANLEVIRDWREGVPRFADYALCYAHWCSWPTGSHRSCECSTRPQVGSSGGRLLPTTCVSYTLLDGC
jgi:hypothetical protein